MILSKENAFAAAPSRLRAALDDIQAPTPAMTRGLIIDGSGSRRWRLRLVRPIGRMRWCGRPEYRCDQPDDRARLLGESKKLEALGHAELRRAGLVFVTARAIFCACGDIHHGGAVVHGTRSYGVLVRNNMRGRVYHNPVRTPGSARPCSRHRREHDRDRDERSENGTV